MVEDGGGRAPSLVNGGAAPLFLPPPLPTPSSPPPRPTYIHPPPPSFSSYTLSFLGVMALFAIGNMILKYKRGRIRRPIRATWPTCFAALAAVLVALVGNVVMAPGNLIYFLVYFGLVAGATLLMFERVRLLKYFLYFVSQGPQHLQAPHPPTHPPHPPTHPAHAPPSVPSHPPGESGMMRRRDGWRR